MEKHEHYTYRITGQRKNVNMSGCAPNSPRCLAGRHAYRRIGGYRESGERNDRRYADAGETRRRRWRKRTSAENWCCA